MPKAPITEECPSAWKCPTRSCHVFSLISAHLLKQGSRLYWEKTASQTLNSNRSCLHGPNRLCTMLLTFVCSEMRWSLTGVESVSLYPSIPNLCRLRRKPLLTLYSLPKHEIFHSYPLYDAGKSHTTLKSPYLNLLTLSLCIVTTFTAKLPLVSACCVLLCLGLDYQFSMGRKES